MDNRSDDLDLIGSLWVATSSKGTKYFNGRMGNDKIIIFKNNNPKNENSPQYFLFRKKEEAEGIGAKQEAKSLPFEDDEIPF